MEFSGSDHIKGGIEALLFISEKPVTLEQIREALETVGLADVRKAVAELKDEYELRKRGMVIVEIAGGYQMLSSPAYAGYIRNFFKTRVKEKLSRPALETLAIIAYKQPVSRGDIELIRGVNSDGVVTHLLNKGLIKITGRRDVPGRPYLYGTTKLFLEYFGLKSLEDLPKLDDFSFSAAALAQGNVSLPEGSDGQTGASGGAEESRPSFSGQVPEEEAAEDPRPAQGIDEDGEGQRPSGPAGDNEQAISSEESPALEGESFRRDAPEGPEEESGAREEAIELKQAMDAMSRDERRPAEEDAGEQPVGASEGPERTNTAQDAQENDHDA